MNQEPVNQEQTGSESRNPKSAGSDATSRSQTARRTVRRLAICYLVLTFLPIPYLAWLVFSAPTPSQYAPADHRRDATMVAEQIIDDLRGQSERLPFFDYHDEYFQFLADEIPDHDDGPDVRRHCDSLIQYYEAAYEDHLLTVKYLLDAAIAAALLAILVYLLPQVWIAALLVLASLAGTSFVSELFYGRDLSHLFVYTIPQLLLSIPILGFAVVGYWANRFEAEPQQREPWILIVAGVLCLTIGIALTAWEMISEGRSSLRTTQGLGAVIAAGIWSLVSGVRQLRNLKPIV